MKKLIKIILWVIYFLALPFAAAATLAFILTYKSTNRNIYKSIAAAGISGCIIFVFWCIFIFSGPEIEEIDMNYSTSIETSIENISQKTIEKEEILKNTPNKTSEKTIKKSPKSKAYLDKIADIKEYNDFSIPITNELATLFYKIADDCNNFDTISLDYDFAELDKIRSKINKKKAPEDFDKYLEYMNEMFKYWNKTYDSLILYDTEKVKIYADTAEDFTKKATDEYIRILDKYGIE